MAPSGKIDGGVVRRMGLGRRTKLISYLATWAFVGIILLAIPTLVSPAAEKTLTQNPSSNTNTAPVGTNRTTTYRFILGSNSSSSVESAQFGLPNNYNNQTFIIRTDSATNITIVTLGNARFLTVTSTAPTNVTVTTKSSAPQAANAAPISSNIPDFTLRLSLVLVPAVVLSSLGLVRVRRRFRREFE